MHIQGPDWRYPLFTQGKRYRLQVAERPDSAGGVIDGVVIEEVLVKKNLVGFIPCWVSSGVRVRLDGGNTEDVRWDDIKDSREI